MKILFIGGTGNISADCAALLKRQGHSIGVLTRGNHSIPAEYASLRADRKKPAELRSAIEAFQPEVVINFLGYEVADVQLDFELLHGRIAQYIFISSTTVYRKPPVRIPITEDTPWGNPWWDYAQKKVECEQWLATVKARLPITILRPSHTYSHRWIPNPIASSNYSFANRLEQGKPVFIPDAGENPWTITAASDFAVGLAGLVGNPKALGEDFHLTGDEVVTWKQIYAEIAGALEAPPPQIVPIPTEFICNAAPELIGNLKGDKSHPGIFDNSKIKKIVPAFRTTKPFAVGIRESVKWLRAHPDQKILNPKVDAMIDHVLSEWGTASK
jgi:nucleoside-diphosphate-sugar epimerase